MQAARLPRLLPLRLPLRLRSMASAPATERAEMALTARDYAARLGEWAAHGALPRWRQVPPVILPWVPWELALPEAPLLEPGAGQAVCTASLGERPQHQAWLVPLGCAGAVPGHLGAQLVALGAA